MKRNEIEVGEVYARSTRFGGVEPVVVLSTEKWEKARPYYSWSTDARRSEKGTGIVVAELPRTGYPQKIDGDPGALADALVARFSKLTDREVEDDRDFQFCALTKITMTWDEWEVESARLDRAAKESAKRRAEAETNAKAERERKAAVAADLSARLEGTGLEVVVKDGRIAVVGDEDSIRAAVSVVSGHFEATTR